MHISIEGKLLVVIDSTFTKTAIEEDYYKRFYKFLPPKYIDGQYENIWDQVSAENTLFPGLGMANILNIPSDSAKIKERTPSRLETLRKVITKNGFRFVKKG
ncbi:hypothetical protein G7Y89_g75 [Cudoniella acicularis]|uniref:Uncharacterized protein n=1 Tax=Cudoniella acicularis TaxID=354080 RepID=A0A8H4W889_9HELO|nr:hypothetical protein G7Y89_g75 [Cudoniella acicularis]